MAIMDRAACAACSLRRSSPALWLTLKYMFKTPVTVNYPFEKGPL